jgi:hypothetical protein
MTLKPTVCENRVRDHLVRDYLGGCELVDSYPHPYGTSATVVLTTAISVEWADLSTEFVNIWNA